MGKVYNNFMEILGPDAFIKGLNYNAGYVYFEGTDEDDEIKTFYFKVRSERTSELYDVEIYVNTETKEIEDYDCDCPQYYKTGVCKHIGAAMLKYSDELLNSDTNAERSNYNLRVSQNILSLFYKPKSHTIRKKLKLQIILDGDYSYYYGPVLYMSFKLGEEKLYSLNNKFSKFMRAYENEEAYQLTTKFTYDPLEHYFGATDKKY